MIKRLFLLAFFSGLLLVVGGYFYLQWWMDQAIPSNEELQIEVPQGQSLIALARRLEGQGIVNADLWLVYARMHGQTAIKAGEYTIESGVTRLALLEKLIAGDVVKYRAQLLEGWTYAQALEYLQSLEYLQIKLAGKSWSVQRQLLGMEWAEHPEGWFFPDTYHYQRGDSDISILIQAHRKQALLLDQLWEDRAQGLPYQTPYEALIMASIVEKETAIDAEREQIAGVFVRRLQKNMRLQTDPTVIYGMGSRYQGNLRRRDLKQATPYNTYVIKGLPPTPIALAGARSLYAALHPDDGTALYFVAKGDGYHQFSDTLEAHNRAVKQYQLKRKADYRSVPQNP